MAVTVLPPVGATSSKTTTGGPAKSVEDLRAALNRAKTTLSKQVMQTEKISMALLLTAEIQASMFGWSFASGYLAKKGKSLKVWGVDVRPVVALLMGGASLVAGEGAVHLLAAANGTLGSFMGELAFDLGVKFATPKEERAAQTAPAAAPATTTSGVVDDTPPSVRLHLAEAGEIGEDETGAGLRLTAQSNIHHWYKVWGREMGQYKRAKEKGHEKVATKALANAQNAKAKGMSIYLRAKDKGRHVVLPDGWKPKARVRRPQQQQARRPQQQFQQPRRPQQQFQQPSRRPQQLEDNGAWEDYEERDDSNYDYAEAFSDGQEDLDSEQQDFFEYLEELDPEELEDISGLASDEEPDDGDEDEDDGFGFKGGGNAFDYPAGEFADLNNLR